MRDFALNKTAYNPALTLNIQAVDGSTTFVHCNADIAEVGPIEAEIPFGGGMGRVSHYTAILAMDIAEWKARRLAVIRGEATLSVAVGSAEFTPHVGRVRHARPLDMTRIQLSIYDRFLDDNPQVPVEAMVDSYSTPHPGVLNVDMGYPLYYGKHSRPVFFTATDCAGVTLLAPRNITSANHVSSVWFSSDPQVPVSSNQSANLLTGYDWAQQSGGTNEAVDSLGLRVKGMGEIDERFWQMGALELLNSSVVSGGYLFDKAGGYFYAKPNWENPAEGYATFTVEKKIPQNIKRTVQADYSITTSNHTSPLISYQMRAQGVESLLISQIIDGVSSSHLSGSKTLVGTDISVFLTEGYVSRFTMLLASSATDPTVVASLSFQAQLESEGYRNYSVYALPPVPADVAISANPVGILVDLFVNHTATPYNVAQSSQAAIDTAACELQCFLAERRALADIAGEFGDICGFNTWVGDGGEMRIKTYQQSGAATVEATLGPDDFDSLRWEEGPVGSSLMAQNFAREVSIDYGWDFVKGAYQSTVRAHPGNNAYCSSMDAGGISTAFRRGSQYVLDDATAAAWLAGEVRRHCQGGAFAEIEGGHHLLPYEVADVLRIQHPLIPSSETLMQVIGTRLDVQRGRQQLTLQELLN